MPSERPLNTLRFLPPQIFIIINSLLFAFFPWPRKSRTRACLPACLRYVTPAHHSPVFSACECGRQYVPTRCDQRATCRLALAQKNKSCSKDLLGTAPRHVLHVADRSICARARRCGAGQENESTLNLRRARMAVNRFLPIQRRFVCSRTFPITFRTFTRCAGAFVCERELPFPSGARSFSNISRPSFSSLPSSGGWSGRTRTGQTRRRFVSKLPPPREPPMPMPMPTPDRERDRPPRENCK